MQIAGLKITTAKPKRPVPPQLAGHGGAKPGSGRKKKTIELARIEARIEELRIRNRYEAERSRYDALRASRNGKMALPEHRALTVDEIGTLRKQLKAIGLDVVHKDGSTLDEGSGGALGFFKSVFGGEDGKQLAQMLIGTVIAANQAKNGGQNGHAPTPAQAPVRRALPEPPAAPTPEPEAIADTPAVEPSAPEESDVARNIQTVIDLLSPLEPAEAARQIVTLAPLFGMAWLVEALTQIPDASRDDLYRELETREARDGAPQGATVLVGWLRERPDWTQQTIEAMRIRRGMAAPVEADGQPASAPAMGY